MLPIPSAESLQQVSEMTDISRYEQKGDKDPAATQPLTFSSTGEVTNPKVREAIKEALQSSTCPPSVKAKIFENMTQAKDSDRERYAIQLRVICEEIARQGYKVNLDGVTLDVGKLSLISFNLTSVTAKGALMKNISFDHCSLNNADLCNANFKDCHFIKTDLRDAFAATTTYENVSFKVVNVTGWTTSNVELHRATQVISTLDPSGKISDRMSMIVEKTIPATPPALPTYPTGTKTSPAKSNTAKKPQYAILGSGSIQDTPRTSRTTCLIL